MGNLRYYSETKSYSAGREIEFFDFVPREGPTGGRVVIDGFWIYADWQLDFATAATEGEDLARIFGRVIVEQRDGTKRWNLPGDASRIACYALLGTDRVSENADQAAANNVTGTTRLYVPMSKPHAHTPEDFALPADEFAKVILTCMSASDMNLGSGTVNVDSVTYYVMVDAHEEHDLQFHCVDVVKADLLTSTSEGVLSISGKLHDLILWARGQSGGASLANLTDVRIDEPLGFLQTSKRTELLNEYRFKRGVAANLNGTMGSEVRADPFATGVACAVMLHDERVSAWEGPILDRAKLSLTNTVASLYAIQRIIKPRSVGASNQVAAAYGLRSADQLTVKTNKKTAKSITDWPRHLHPFLPLKAPLRRAG